MTHLKVLKERQVRRSSVSLSFTSTAESVFIHLCFPPLLRTQRPWTLPDTRLHPAAWESAFHGAHKQPTALALTPQPGFSSRVPGQGGAGPVEVCAEARLGGPGARGTCSPARAKEGRGTLQAPQASAWGRHVVLFCRIPPVKPNRVLKSVAQEKRPRVWGFLLSNGAAGRPPPLKPRPPSRFSSPRRPPLHPSLALTPYEQVKRPLSSRRDSFLFVLASPPPPPRALPRRVPALHLPAVVLSHRCPAAPGPLLSSLRPSTPEPRGDKSMDPQFPVQSLLVGLHFVVALSGLSLCLGIPFSWSPQNQPCPGSSPGSSSSVFFPHPSFVHALIWPIFILPLLVPHREIPCIPACAPVRTPGLRHSVSRAVTGVLRRARLRWGASRPSP